MADTYADQMREIAELQQQIDLMQGQQDAREEKKTDIPAWLRLRKWAVGKGLANLPTSPKRMIQRIKDGGSLCQQLVKEQPALAAELGISDDELELPLVIIQLLSDPTIEPSVALGRKLMESGPLNDLIALAPSRKATITLAVKAWREDQQRQMTEGLDALKKVTAEKREAVQRSIAAGGNPMARASVERQENHKREVLRAAGIRVGSRR